MKNTTFSRGGHTVEIVFNDPWMKRLAKLQGLKSLTMTVSPKKILTSLSYIPQKRLAHEWGHVLHAIELGWKWTLHVGRSYLFQGYKGSLFEQRAVMYQEAYQPEFPVYLGVLP